ncbi:MAG TPA: PEP-CTERM sorting domain-containing protein [Phycisphaerae bacterium]|nr:PEP-CTERM sorting domain-containing protein [Phycisphaerae bacterium]HNU44192.1 PEP-CTERM sorting domain-containing protein [Phycisphaerae bacterium]
MNRWLWAALLGGLMGLPAEAGLVVLDFEDLEYGEVLSGTTYGDISWEFGSGGYLGRIGYWMTPSSPNGNYPASGQRNLINCYGDTQLGLAFAHLANIEGAYFSGQGHPTAWTPAVRVHAYRNGAEVGTTPWLEGISAEPQWLAIGFDSVDRLVVEAVPVVSGGGWYGLDDLTFFAHAPEPGTLVLLLGGVGLVARRMRHRRGS